MNANYLAAAKKAEQVRIKLSLKSLQPINVFDVCEELGVTVRFLDVSMEGMYFSQTGGKNPAVIISSQRPLPRRVYTCAHELGHHLFGHGTKVDPLEEGLSDGGTYNEEERLVDTFAGLLLMPIAGVQAEFKRRGWKVKTASQMEYFIISSIFGVGYQTLITHCKVNHLITDLKAIDLLKAKPAKLFSSFCNLPLKTSSFKVIDGLTKLNTTDTEVGNYLILPKDTVCEGEHLTCCGEVPHGRIFQATQPGIIRIYSADVDFGCFVRIQNAHYAGLAENRHLENDLD
jgi:Zn-dependent peptidase ImmA (M78 family)